MVGIKLIFLAVAMTLAHFVPVVGVLPLTSWCLGFPVLMVIKNRTRIMYGNNNRIAR